MANSMREHREKMLAKKAQMLQQSGDPRLKNQSRPTFVGVDIATGDVDRTVEITVPSPTVNIELRLFSQLNELNDTKSIQEKIAKKKQWLPDYVGYIEGCLAVSPSVQNNTLMQLMIWAIDAGSYDLGVRIAEYAILNDMVMPEDYKRGIAEFVTEQCATDFIDDIELAIANASIIDRIIELGVGEQMFDQVRAKIYRAKGDALNDAQPVEALSAYKNALRLNSKVGCKKEITALEKLLNKQSTESSPDATVGSQAGVDVNITDTSVPASTDNPVPTAESAPTAETASVDTTATE